MYIKVLLFSYPQRILVDELQKKRGVLHRKTDKDHLSSVIVQVTRLLAPYPRFFLGYGGVKATNKQKAEQLRTNFSKQFSDQRTLQQRRGKSKIQLRKQTPNPKRSVSKKTSFSLYIEKNNKNNKKGYEKKNNSTFRE